ncbi:hypothetical protein EU520_01070, partial [Candidatus Thorarchaeota archaeon]
EEWDFADCSRSDTNKWTHGYHRYPAKFIPQIVEKLFDIYITTETAHVADPFYGSGTTIATAISRGYRATGTDINGIAYLITRAKATPIEPDYLSEKVRDFLRRARATVSEQTPSAAKIDKTIPERHAERIDYWFPSQHREELGAILSLIIREEDQRVRTFLLVGFSHILKTCSIWLQRSTKPTRDTDKTPTKPYVALRRHLRQMVRGNRDFYEVVPKHVRSNLEDYLDIRRGDAGHQHVEDESIDLIVTSSPYVTSYEYADLHQLSTIWLDLAADLRTYRENFIGSAYRSEEPAQFRSEIGQSVVERVRENDERTADEIAVFFGDMDRVFDESFRILRPGGRCCFVIGNTTLKGVDILNAQVFAESIQYSGFQLDRVIKRQIPSKTLPQTRDKKTGRFTSASDATSIAYPVEFIVVGRKP